MRRSARQRKAVHGADGWQALPPTRRPRGRCRRSPRRGSARRGRSDRCGSRPASPGRGRTARATANPGTGMARRGTRYPAARGIDTRRTAATLIRLRPHRSAPLNSLSNTAPVREARTRSRRGLRCAVRRQHASGTSRPNRHRAGINHCDPYNAHRASSRSGQTIDDHIHQTPRATRSRGVAASRVSSARVFL